MEQAVEKIKEHFVNFFNSGGKAIQSAFVLVLGLAILALLILARIVEVLQQLIEQRDLPTWAEWMRFRRGEANGKL